MRVVCLAGLLAASCAFDAAVPVDAVISCTSSGDCPDGGRCVDVIGRCVNRISDGSAPAAVDVELPDFILGSNATFAGSFAVDEALLVSPTVTVGSGPDARELVATLRDDRWSASIEASLLSQGTLPVTTTLADLGGVFGIALLGIVTVDLTPTRIVPASIAFKIKPPAGSLVTNPTALALGGRATLDFTVDDLALVEVTAVEVNSGTRVAFTATGGDSLRHSFELRGGEAAGGHYAIEVILTDEADNVDISTLPDEFDVVAIIAPPCTFVDGAGAAVCTDLDGDGAAGPAGGCVTATDCDDTDAAIGPASVDVPGSGRDGNCDGVATDSDANVVFVAANGVVGSGTRANPTNDLQAAVDQAGPGGFVFVRADTLATTTVVVPAGVSLIGGFDAGFIDVVGKTTIAGQVVVEGSPVSVLLRGLTIDTGATGTCRVLDVAPGEGTVLINNVSVSGVGSDGCDAGTAAGVLIERSTIMSRIDVAFDAGDGGDTVGINVQRELSPVRLLDSDVEVRSSIRAIAVRFHDADGVVIRSHLVARDGVDLTAAIQAFPDARRLTVLGSILEADGGAIAIVYGAALSLVMAHSTLRGAGAFGGTAIQADGDARVWSSVIDLSGGGGTAFVLDEGENVTGVGEVRVHAVTIDVPCYSRLESGFGCSAANACEMNTPCIGSERNLNANIVVGEGGGAEGPLPGDNLVASPLTDAVALGVDVDISSLAIDADGDCRGASGLDAGADERP